ncbi:MAG: proteophosphoglycan ppg1, partial [bacterium]
RARLRLGRVHNQPASKFRRVWSGPQEIPSGASLPPYHRTGASQPVYPSAPSQAAPAATLVTPAVTQPLIMAMPLPSAGGSQPQISAPLSSGSTQPMDATSASAGLVTSPSPVAPPTSCSLHRVPNGLWAANTLPALLDLAKRVAPPSAPAPAYCALGNPLSMGDAWTTLQATAWSWSLTGSSNSISPPVPRMSPPWKPRLDCSRSTPIGRPTPQAPAESTPRNLTGTPTPTLVMTPRLTLTPPTPRPTGFTSRIQTPTQLSACPTPPFPAALLPRNYQALAPPAPPAVLADTPADTDMVIDAGIISSDDESVVVEPAAPVPTTSTTCPPRAPAPVATSKRTPREKSRQTSSQPPAATRIPPPSAPMSSSLPTGLLAPAARSGPASLP